jgi:hypothetical protein
MLNSSTSFIHLIKSKSISFFILSLSNKLFNQDIILIPFYALNEDLKTTDLSYFTLNSEDFDWSNQVYQLDTNVSFLFYFFCFLFFLSFFLYYKKDGTVD